jgi:Uma2 family endonuclease
MQAIETAVTVDFSRRYTLEEFWELPEPENRAHYELIGGYLYIVPAPDPPHGDVAADMLRALITFVIANKIDGKVHFPKAAIYRRAEGSTYLEPDLMYVSKALRERMGSKRTSADIVFEIISRGTSIYDHTTKADAYLTLDVRELWLVDPFTLTVKVHYRSAIDKRPVWEIVKYATGEYAKSRVLAGWEVSVDELFKDLR